MDDTVIPDLYQSALADMIASARDGGDPLATGRARHYMTMSHLTADETRADVDRGVELMRLGYAETARRASQLVHAEQAGAWYGPGRREHTPVQHDG